MIRQFGIIGMPRKRVPIELRKGRGEELKRRRGAAGLTQAGLGELLGVSAQQVGKYERGESAIPDEILEFARNGFVMPPGQASGLQEDDTLYISSDSRVSALIARWNQIKSDVDELLKSVDNIFRNI